MKKIIIKDGEPRQFESEEPLTFGIGGQLFTLPGPLKAISAPDGTYHIRFSGEGFSYRGVLFRGTVSFRPDGSVTGNINREITLTNTEQPMQLRLGAEVNISPGGMLLSTDTYMIEGDCNAKKCALSRDLNRDPIGG